MIINVVDGQTSNKCMEDLEKQRDSLISSYQEKLDRVNKVLPSYMFQLYAELFQELQTKQTEVDECLMLLVERERQANESKRTSLERVRASLASVQQQLTC